MAFGLIAGTVIAIIWRYDVSWTVYEQPYLLETGAFALALLVAVPSLLAGVWAFIQGRWSYSARRLLAFFGPLVVALGTEIGSHLLIRCDITPFICQDGSIYDRWHQIHHNLVAGLPLLILYYLAQRKFKAE